MKMIQKLFAFWLILWVASPSAYGAKDWIKYETPHYMIVSQANKDATSYIGQLMENIYEEYSSRFTFQEKIKGRFVLRIFENQKVMQEYLSFLGGSPNWAGAYIRERKELVISFQQSRIALRTLLFHEGFHQFLEYYLQNIPVWFNEGLAEYFGYAIPSGPKKFLFGTPILEHLRLLSDGYDKGIIPPIGKVVGAPHASFHDSSNEKYYYAKSWLLIHYLINQRKDTFNKMFHFLIAKEPIPYPDLLGPATSLENKLKSYLDEMLAKSGENLFEEGQMYFQKRNFESAMNKFTLALGKNPYHVKSRHYRGLIHYQNKNYHAAIRDFSKIIHLGYDWPATFYYRGLSNFYQGNKKDAFMDLNIARSLDPNNPMIPKTLEELQK